jgi:hypothetical protein
VAGHNSLRHLLKVQVAYLQYGIADRHFGVGWRCCFELLKGDNVEEYEHLQLQQAQLAGAGYSFGTTLNL